MALSFVDLPADIFPYIFRYLDMPAMIAFALTCRIFRQMCMDAKVFRKLDLSRCCVSTTQRGVINDFFRDRQLTQHIRELDVSNLRVLNWQMDDQFEEFIISICPQLEVLHVVDCGMSLQRLCRIFSQAPKLTSLSWSLWNVTSQDIQFLSKSTKSSELICFRNIKHLHLEILHSFSHLQVAKYLLLSCFGDLEELEIYTWSIDKEECTGCSYPLRPDQTIPGFPQPSVENELRHLHSLMLVPVGSPIYATFDDFKEELSDFVVSVLSRKSRSTKWGKFWMLPTIGLCREHWSLLLDSVHEDDFQSVEAYGADAGESLHAVDDLKTLFQRIGDNTVRSLHLCLPYGNNSIAEFCDPILRVGGHSLKFLRLSVHLQHKIRAEQNSFMHILFSNCSNITELDLLYCYFGKDICEPLSQLKHLTKIQLMQCAISSKHCDENQVGTSNANLLTFVENCQNITDLDVRGCRDYHMGFSCCLTDDDLLTFSKLRNLKSLTLYEISGITEWTFVQNISEHCKFLTMLRISAWKHFENSRIPILMESTKFLKHLAISVKVPVLESEVFWDLLSHAKSLQRLCISSFDRGLMNIPVAVEALKSLPQLHVLHLHTYSVENVEDFYDKIIRMLEEKESDYRFSFEIVTTTDRRNTSEVRRNTWINHQTGYSLISNKALPLSEAELCEKKPILNIPRF